MESEVEDEGPPLAVPISQEENSSLVSSPPAAAGVTIITGYLGAGKSTVVDAKNLRLQLSEQRDCGKLPEAFLQIAFADVVLLNKVDLIVEEHEGIAQSQVLENLKMEIQNINSLARIICTVRCQVDLNDILDCKAYDSKHVAHLEALLAESNLGSNSHNHDSEVKTICVAEQGSMSIDQVNACLGELLWEGKGNMELYRCKGVLNILGSDEVHIIQAVRDLYEIIPGRKWKAGENRINKIVFIGRKLDLNILSTSLKSCLAN